MKYKALALSLLCLAFSMDARWIKKPNMTLKSIEDFALNNEQNMWATARDGVYRWENNAWVQKKYEIEPPSISVSRNNVPYVIMPNYGKKGGATIDKFDGTAWHIVSNVKDIQVLAPKILFAENADDIWLLKEAKKPFHWNGKKWEQKGSGFFTVLGIGRDGTVIGVRRVQGEGEEEAQTTSFVQWNGKAWKEFSQVSEFTRDLAVIDKDNIWIVKSDKRYGSDYYLYKWDTKNKQWIKKEKMKIRVNILVADRDGMLWIADLDGNFYQWKPELTKKHSLSRPTHKTTLLNKNVVPTGKLRRQKRV